jgi:hypothetical protein
VGNGAIQAGRRGKISWAARMPPGDSEKGRRAFGDLDSISRTRRIGNLSPDSLSRSRLAAQKSRPTASRKSGTRCATRSHGRASRNRSTKKPC